MLGSSKEVYSDIGALDFGKADGKKESRKSNFESLFYDGDGYYYDLCDDDKYLIVGRKGTGKSLLTRYFKKMKEKESFNYCEIVEINKFLRKKLKTFDYESIKNQEMSTFWRYIFLTELARMIRNQKNALLSDLVIDQTEGYTVQSITQEEVEELNGKISANLSSIGVSIDGKENSKTTKELKRSPYYEKMDTLSEQIYDYMNKTNTSYFLVFDDIDELESLCQSREEFTSLALAFLQALDEINDELFEEDTQSKIISTFRSDILDELNENSNNLNRSMYDSVIKIDWYSSLVKTVPHETPLIKMILHKIRYSSSEENKGMNDKELYEHYFPSDSNGQNNHAEYLLRHSFGRPRDIIIFLQTYQNLFKKDAVFDYSNFDSCKKNYSSWLYSEVKNEINISNKKREIGIALEAIKQNQKRYFKLNLFENRYNRLKKIEGFTSKLSAEEILNDLYTLGIVGNVSFRKNSMNRYWFAYRDGSSLKPDPNKEFVVHFGLQNYLSL